jgi:hypothetical protein
VRERVRGGMRAEQGRERERERETYFREVWSSTFCSDGA